MRYTRQILALLALAAGWMVLVADGGLEPCAMDDVQYEFQTNCMGEPVSGLFKLNKKNGSCAGNQDFLYGAEIEQIREQGLPVQSVTVLFKKRDGKLTPIGFDFEIKGESVDAPSNPDTTAPTFVCIDSRTHETLAVNKDYLCENKENPSETCELKLTYLPRE